MQDFFLHYCLVKELAAKTLRTTYLAYPLREKQKKVILKIFDKECANQDHEMNSVRLSALMSMDHPYIVPILDIDKEQGKPYIVSEYRALGSLSQRLGSPESGSHERMDWPDVIRIVQQIGQALSYAHSYEIIHGNLKPENIFYFDNDVVQLTDFSLAPFIDVTKLGYKADLHTTKYMAPEQFVGKTEKASDQYALACLAYELITGHAPFEAQSFSSMWGKHTNDYAAPLSSHVKVPMPIDAALLRALAKQSEDRYEDMDAFLLALNNGLSASTAKEPSESDSTLATLLSNVPDGVKKAPVTQPFGFTPFPEVVERAQLVRQPDAPEIVVTPQQSTLLAIDPPALAALKQLAARGKAAPQPNSQSTTAYNNVSTIPGGDTLESVSSVGDEPEQATNPLPVIADNAYVRHYNQLLPETEEERDLVFPATFAEAEEEPLAVVPSWPDSVTKTTSTVLAQPSIAEKVDAFQSTPTATDLFHSHATASPPQKRSAFTSLPLSGRKRFIAVLGVLLLLATIASVLLYSFNAGLLTLGRHTPMTVIVTTLPTTSVTQKVQPTATPLPTPRPTVRPTRVSQRPTPAPASTPVLAQQPAPTPAPTSATAATAANTYSFEDGTFDAWQVSGGSAANSTTMARTGEHSLVITQPNVNTGTSDRNPYLYMEKGTASLLKAGQTIGASIYVPSGSMSIEADISVADANDKWYGSNEFVLSSGSWNYISYTTQSFSAPMREIGINLYYTTSNKSTVQPVYIDDISW